MRLDSVSEGDLHAMFALARESQSNTTDATEILVEVEPMFDSSEHGRLRGKVESWLEPIRASSGVCQGFTHRGEEMHSKAIFEVVAKGEFYGPGETGTIVMQGEQMLRFLEPAHVDQFLRSVVADEYDNIESADVYAIIGYMGLRGEECKGLDEARLARLAEMQDIARHIGAGEPVDVGDDLGKLVSRVLSDRSREWVYSDRLAFARSFAEALNGALPGHVWEEFIGNLKEE